MENLEALGIKVKKLAQSGMSDEEIMMNIFRGEHRFSKLTNRQFSTLNLVKSLLEI